MPAKEYRSAFRWYVDDVAVRSGDGITAARWRQNYPDADIREVQVETQESRNALPEGAYRSPHFDQPNILAHIRFNDRTDADGKRVLFIEEIQSDWGQKGKKEGFEKGPLSVAETSRRAALLAMDDDAMTENQMGELSALNARMLGVETGVPSAPFVTETKSWVALAVKRMISYAARGGYDKVAFVTGEQSAARYDLSKSLSSVIYHADEQVIEGIGLDGELAVEKNGVAPDKLESVVGKEIAEALLRQLEKGITRPTVSGDNLKVGGEGMKTFYNQIVPQVANDVLKKLGGGKIGPVVLSGAGFQTKAGDEADALLDELGVEVVGERTGSQPGFDITDALREKAVEGLPLFQGEGARGSFDPETDLITLLKGADLSTFLHESAHFFFEDDITLAAELLAKPDLSPGEQAIIDDVSRLMTWHGVQGTPQAQVAQWYGMGFEERRAYHERTAESFEAYLFEGKAPSIELQPYFQKFRAWLLNVYKSIKAFLAGHPEAGKLNDDIRAVFDRMLATTEAIQLAEQGRSLTPLFETPEQAGMTPEAFAEYQALGVDATQAAIQDLQAKGLRDMQWLHNARSREIKKLQRQSKERRAEVKMEARRQVLSQPVYRAWQFLTNKLTPDDKIAPIVPPKSVKGPVDPSIDTLFVAIAKLGGIQRSRLESEWGLDPETKNPMPLFGQYVLRREGGRTIDGMAEALTELGYLTADEHGKWDLTELEEKFANALGGAPEYSIGVDPAILVETEPRAGDQVVNPEALGAGRLDIAELRMLDLPEAVLQRLVDNRMTAETGLHQDIVAELLGGFDSGEALVRAVAAAEQPRVAIEGLTDRMMLEQYGELATPEAIERAADAAIHNDARARFVATEANALARATGKPRILAAAAKAFAADMIARKKIRDLRPGQYAAIEARAARAAAKASRAGDIAQAAAQKRNQVINIYAARATHEAQDEVERIIRHFKQLQKTGSQKGMRGEFLVQLNGLLARFDLSTRSTLPKKALAEWVIDAAEKLAAVAPDLPAWVLDETQQKPYREMTLEELRGLNDAVRQLEHLARREHTMYKAVRDQNYEQEVASILDELRHVHPEAFNSEGPLEYRKDSLPLVKELVGRFKSGFDAQLVNIENLLDIMARGRGRAIFESLFGRLSAAADAQTLMMKQMSEFIKPYTQVYTYRERLDFAFSKRLVPGTLRYMTHEQRLSVALFYGSEEGRQRLVDGNRLPESDIRAILDALDERDWAVVKALWQLSEEMLWPRLAALNERTVGIAPPKVVAMPIETRYGTMPGGYAPLVYDGDMDTRAHDLNTNSAVQELLGGTATQAATQRSASKTRVDKVNRPLDLSLRAAAFKLNETVHDIAFREAIADTYRLLQGKRIGNAIRSIAGPDVYSALLSRVREVAVKPHTPSGFMEKTFWYLRKNTLINMMGASFNTVAINILGVLPSMRRVGAGRYLAAIGRFTSPEGAERYRWVMEKSVYMRERIQSFDRDMHEELTRLSGRAHLMPSLGFWFAGLAAMDRATTMPLWWAAYEQGMAEFDNDEAAALDHADRVVRQTHGSGRVVDLAKMAGGVGPAGELKRIATMFYNFFNAQLGMVRRGATLARAEWEGGNHAKAAAMITLDVLAVIIIPATLEAIARGQCGDDPDAEDYLYCGARASAFFTSGFFPLLRDFIPFTWRQFDPEVKGFSVRISPVENALETLGRMPKAAVDTATGEGAEADDRTLVRGFGYLFGLPGFQTWRTLDGYRALQEGETDNPAILLTGPHN